MLEKVIQIIIIFFVYKMINKVLNFIWKLICKLFKWIRIGVFFK